MLIQTSECHEELKKRFYGRPKDNNLKAHSFVRSANDYMKLTAVSKIPVGNIVIDIGSKYR